MIRRELLTTNSILTYLDHSIDVSLGSMTVQIDLLHRDQILSMPELVYADELSTGWEEFAPAKLLSLIVMEADGAIVPVSYGFSRAIR